MNQSDSKSWECMGDDIFVIAKEIPKLPMSFGSMKLQNISQRGMKVWPGEKPSGVILDWYCCRYISEIQVADSEILEAASQISKSYSWEKIQKLFRQNGQNQFAGVYES